VLGAPSWHPSVGQEGAASPRFKVPIGADGDMWSPMGASSRLQVHLNCAASPGRCRRRTAGQRARSWPQMPQRVQISWEATQQDISRPTMCPFCASQRCWESLAIWNKGNPRSRRVAAGVFPLRGLAGAAGCVRGSARDTARPGCGGGIHYRVGLLGGLQQKGEQETETGTTSRPGGGYSSAGGGSGGRGGSRAQRGRRGSTRSARSQSRGERALPNK